MKVLVEAELIEEEEDGFIVQIQGTGFNSTLKVEKEKVNQVKTYEKEN